MGARLTVCVDPAEAVPPRVSDKATRASVFMGFTLPADRPAGAKDERSIVLGESSRGVPPPIVAWYPNGDRHGRSFIYPSN